MGYTQFDYVVFGVILVSGLLAMMRGFVREIFSLAAWAGAFVITIKYYSLAEPWALRYINKPAIAMYAAMLFVFCVSFVVFSVLGSLLSGLVRGRALTALDRSLGFVFGLLRGMLICCLIYLAAVSIVWPDTDRTPEQSAVAQSEEAPAAREKTRIVAPDWLLAAKTRPFLREGAEILRGFIPQKAIDKTTTEYMEDKTKAHDAIEKQEELDRLSTPVNENHTIHEKGSP